MVKKITGPPLPNPGEYLRPDGKSQVSFRNVPAAKNTILVSLHMHRFLFQEIRNKHSFQIKETVFISEK